jgi:DNA-binding NarL/FixJ family response regulator
LPEVKFGEANNYAELIDLISNKKWDILILDLNMPGRSGLEALIEVKKLNPDLPVLVLSMYPENQFAARVIKAGAMGYLTKGSSSNELIDAITSISDGGVYLTKEVAKILTTQLRSSNKSKLESLSDREYQVFLSLARGETISEIGRKLSLSPKTISTYKTRIMEKLELQTNTDLIKFAIENNLLD